MHGYFDKSKKVKELPELSLNALEISFHKRIGSIAVHAKRVTFFDLVPPNEGTP